MLTSTHTYEDYYEAYKKQLISQCEARNVDASIKKLLTKIDAQSEFKVMPYVLRGASDVAGQLSDKLLFKGLFDGSGVVNEAINAVYDYKDKRLIREIETIKNDIALQVMDGLKALPKPTNIKQALAYERVMADINPYYLSQEGKQQKREFLADAHAIRVEFKELKDDAFEGVALEQLHEISQANDMLIDYQLFELDALRDIQNTLVSQGSEISEFHLDVKGEHAEIVNQCKALGISLKSNKQLLYILVNNTASREQVNGIIVHLQKNHLRKLEKEQHKAFIAQYQGVAAACQFVHQLGQMTGCRELSMIATVARASVDISMQVQQLLTQTMSLAVLNPIAGIGMAVLSVISLFKKTTNPSKIILEQIQKLSQQIHSLHEDMMKGFIKVHSHLREMTKLLLDTLIHFQYTLAVPMFKQLSQMSKNIYSAIAYSGARFDELQLQLLQKLMGYAYEYKQGYATFSDEKVQKYCIQSANWMVRHALNPGLTGVEFYRLREDNPRLVTQALKDALYKNRLASFLGFILADAQARLALTTEVIAFNPIVWRCALHAYLDFRYTQVMNLGEAKKPLYDPDLRRLHELYEAADNIQTLLIRIQSKPEIFKSILTDLQAMIQCLTDKFEIAKTNYIRDLGITSIIDYHPDPVRCEFSEASMVDCGSAGDRHASLKLLESLGITHTARDRSQHRININEAIVTLLSDSGMPEIFKLAEQLGLGHFKLEFCGSKYNGGKQRQYAKTTGNQYGFNIDFKFKESLGGAIIRIYTAKSGALHWAELRNGLHNRQEQVRLFIQNYRVRTIFTLKETELNFAKNIVNDYIAHQNTKASDNVLAELEDGVEQQHIEYLQILMLVYLHVLGMPPHLIENWQALFDEDIYADFRKNPKLDISLNLPSNKAVNNFMNDLELIIYKATHPDCEEEKLSSMVLSLIHSGLTELDQFYLFTELRKGENKKQLPQKRYGTSTRIGLFEETHEIDTVASAVTTSHEKKSSGILHWFGM